jgi:hypothetical protein
MAISQAVISRVNPGRTLDAIALASSAAKLVERHGGHQIRLIATDVMGEQVGMLLFISEFDSLSEYGAFADAITADSEVQALVERASAPDSPVTLVAQQLAADVPGGRPPRAGRGNVIEVYLMRVEPGGHQRFIESSSRFRELVEGQGAVATRLVRILHGGSQTDLYASVAEYADHQSWGRATETWTASPEGLQLESELNTGALPAQIVSSGLYVEVPI